MTLYRPRDDRIIAGVCSGIARRFNLDPTIVRIMWVVATFVTFPMAPIAYVILAALIPQEPVTSPTDTFMI